MKQTILVSACLLGRPCRYDGASRAVDWIGKLQGELTLIPVCPEAEGGLPTPRPRAERRGERVVNEAGQDVTEAYRAGAALALDRAREHRCCAAILKGKSPSCGKGIIYDGSFTGTLIPGDGVAAQLLQEAALPVFTEEEAEAFLACIGRQNA